MTVGVEMIILDKRIIIYFKFSLILFYAHLLWSIYVKLFKNLICQEIQSWFKFCTVMHSFLYALTLPYIVSHSDMLSRLRKTLAFWASNWLKPVLAHGFLMCYIISSIYGQIPGAELVRAGELHSATKFRISFLLRTSILGLLIGLIHFFES